MTEVSTGDPSACVEAQQAIATDEDSIYVEKAGKIIAAEKEIVTAALKRDDGRLFGLALSGGGIRSASFAMGVMQALNSTDKTCGVLGRMHYLSTVSGGGYTGSSYTWFRKHFPQFPFGVRLEGIRAQPREIGTQILSYIRQYGSYLFPTLNLGIFSAIAMVGWAIAWSLIIYSTLIFSVEVILFGLLPGALDGRWLVDFLLEHGIPLREHAASGGGSYFMRWSPWPYVLLAATVTAVLSAFGLLFIGWTAWLKATYRARRTYQQVAGWFLIGVVSLLGVALVPFLHYLLKKTGDFVSTNTLDILKNLDMPAASGVVGIVFGIGVAVYRFLKEMKSDVGQPPANGEWLVITGTVLLILGILVTTYDLAHHYLMDHDAWNMAICAAIALIAGLVLGRMVNINRVSIHALYRDRLMEVFLPSLTCPAKSHRDPIWRPANKANDTPLSQMCGFHLGQPVPPSTTPDKWDVPHTPYHIINTNIVLAGSQRKEFRGRGGDNFILSPLYCGSDATGYQKTYKYMDDQTTLASAMAISGAAVNPNCGVGGRGVTRNAWVSLLLGFLNIRLGVWFLRPQLPTSKQESRLWKIVKWILRAGTPEEHPDFINPGIRSMAMGGGSEKFGYIELSDGGHFENTGLYELARRELDVIIVSDAGADPSFALGDLGNAIERVRVDFGAVIRFGSHAFDLSHIIPGSGLNPVLVRKFGIAERGFAIGSIQYGSGKIGAVIYLKPTMTADLPADVFAYRATCPEFPHQPTEDQFFDENQLESYRELGYQTAWAMWEAVAALTDAPSPPDEAPPSVHLEFHKLKALHALR